MKTLLTAIETYFNATTALTDVFTGGLHFQIAADGTAQPYLVYDVIAAPTTNKYGGAAFHSPMIQFTSYATGLAALTNIETLRTQFADRTFTLSSGQNLFMQQLNDAIPVPTDKDESGVDVYGWQITYEFATTT